jgi:hypothetical protein
MRKIQGLLILSVFCVLQSCYVKEIVYHVNNENYYYHIKKQVHYPDTLKINQKSNNYFLIIHSDLGKAELYENNNDSMIFKSKYNDAKCYKKDKLYIESEDGLTKILKLKVYTPQISDVENSNSKSKIRKCK